MVVYIYSTKSCKATSSNLLYIERALNKIYPDILIYSFDEMNNINKEEVSKVIISGGDGTFNNVINYFKEYLDKIVFGFIPLGTANDFCNNNHIKKIDEALKVIEEDKVIEKELYVSNDRIIMYAISVGNISKVSLNTKSDSKKHFGKLIYKIKGIKYLFCKKSEILIDDKKIKTKEIIITNSNYLGGVRISNKKDNKIRLYALNNFFSVVDLFIFGRFKKHNNKIYDNLLIESDSIWCIDGEGYNKTRSNILKSNFKIKMLSKNT